MYKKIRPTRTEIRINHKPVKGEPLEAKIRRLINNGEPISEGAPVSYTEREEGVKPEYDPRTDKWDIAIDKISGAVDKHKLGRELKAGEKVYDTMNEEQQKAFDKKFPENKGAKNKAAKGAGGEAKASQ